VGILKEMMRLRRGFKNGRLKTIIIQLNIIQYKSQHFAVSYVIAFDCDGLFGTCEFLHRFRVGT
jgi:hypothetical protein